MDERKVNSEDENNFDREDTNNKLEDSGNQEDLAKTPDMANSGETERTGIWGKFIQNIKNGAFIVYRTFLRFPLTLVMFAVIAAIIIYMTEMPYSEIRNRELGRIIAVLVLGVSFSLTVTIFTEKFWGNINNLKRLISYVVQIGILFAYYFFLFPSPDMVPMVRVSLITFAMFLAFLYISYLRGKENFEVFITKIISKVIVTGFFTVVIALGLILTLFAVKSLLYNPLDEKFYFYTWVLAWFIYAPIHFLSGFPKVGDTLSIKDYNNVQKILLTYIILPIITIYTLVLYIYFGKIIITQVWPNGIVSNLVVSYTFVGIVSIFLLTPFFRQNKWVDIFRSIYLKAIFPLLGMMFVSIGIRINQFGFTENRYFVLIIGLWATFAVVFMNIYKGRKNVVLPITLSIIAFLTVCGPWSAFSVSKLSQNLRLQTILSKYNMISDGKIIKSKVEVPDNDKKETSEILRYFNESHKFSDVKYLPANFDLNKMKEVFGFEETYIANNTSYFNYFRPQDAPIMIKGYDILLGIEYYNSNLNSDVIYQNSVDTEYGKIKVTINKKYEMSIFRNKQLLYSYNVLKNIDEFNKKYGRQLIDKGPSEQELIFTDSNNKLDVKIVYNEISAVQSGKGTNGILLNNLRASLLIKFK